MTPEERANKVREMLHPEGDLILPPGSIILIPDEIRAMFLDAANMPEEQREAIRIALGGEA